MRNYVLLIHVVCYTHTSCDLFLEGSYSLNGLVVYASPSSISGHVQVNCPPTVFQNGYVLWFVLFINLILTHQKLLLR